MILCDTLWYFGYLAILCDYCVLWYLVILCDALWYFVIPCDALWYFVIPCGTLWYVLYLVTLRVLKPCTDTKFVNQICATSYDKWMVEQTGMILGWRHLKLMVIRYSDCVIMWCDHKLCVLNQLSPNRTLYGTQKKTIGHLYVRGKECRKGVELPLTSSTVGTYTGSCGLPNAVMYESYRARSIQPKFPEISVQNSMDRLGPTGKVSKKLVHLLRWSSFPGRTGLNFGWMDRAHRVPNFHIWFWRAIQTQRNSLRVSARYLYAWNIAFIEYNIMSGTWKEKKKEVHHEWILTIQVSFVVKNISVQVV